MIPTMRMIRRGFVVGRSRRNSISVVNHHHHHQTAGRQYPLTSSSKNGGRLFTTMIMPTTTSISIDLLKNPNNDHCLFGLSDDTGTNDKAKRAFLSTTVSNGENNNNEKDKNNFSSFDIPTRHSIHQRRPQQQKRYQQQKLFRRLQKTKTKQQLELNDTKTAAAAAAADSTFSTNNDNFYRPRLCSDLSTLTRLTKEVLSVSSTATANASTSPSSEEASNHTPIGDLFHVNETARKAPTPSPSFITTITSNVTTAAAASHAVTTASTTNNSSTSMDDIMMKAASSAGTNVSSDDDEIDGMISSMIQDEIDYYYQHVANEGIQLVEYLINGYNAQIPNSLYYSSNNDEEQQQQDNDVDDEKRIDQKVMDPSIVISAIGQLIHRIEQESDMYWKFRSEYGTEQLKRMMVLLKQQQQQQQGRGSGLSSLSYEEEEEEEDDDKVMKADESNAGSSSSSDDDDGRENSGSSSSDDDNDGDNDELFSGLNLSVEEITSSSSSSAENNIDEEEGHRIKLTDLFTSSDTKIDDDKLISEQLLLHYQTMIYNTARSSCNGSTIQMYNAYLDAIAVTSGSSGSSGGGVDKNDNNNDKDVPLSSPNDILQIASNALYGRTYNTNDDDDDDDGYDEQDDKFMSSSAVAMEYTEPNIVTYNATLRAVANIVSNNNKNNKNMHQNNDESMKHRDEALLIAFTLYNQLTHYHRQYAHYEHEHNTANKKSSSSSSSASMPSSSFLQSNIPGRNTATIQYMLQIVTSCIPPSRMQGNMTVTLWTHARELGILTPTLQESFNTVWKNLSTYSTNNINDENDADEATTTTTATSWKEFDELLNHPLANPERISYQSKRNAKKFQYSKDY